MRAKFIVAGAGALLLAAAPLAAAPIGNAALGTANELPIQLAQGPGGPGGPGPSTTAPAPREPSAVTPRGPSQRTFTPRSSPRVTGPGGPSRRFTGPGGPNPRFTGPRGPSQRFYGPGPSRSYARFNRDPGRWHHGRRFWAYPAFGAGLLAFTLAPGWYWGDYYDECLRYIVPCHGCAPVLVDLCEQPY